MKKTVLVGLLVMVLVFCFIGCGGDDSKDEFKMTWGVWWPETYSNISSEFSNAGNPLISAGTGTNAGYLTGADAEYAFQVISNLFYFDDDGTRTGSYEGLLNYKVNGIGLPPELKAVMAGQKGNVPVGGVFQFYDGINNVALFYIERN